MDYLQPPKEGNDYTERVHFLEDKKIKKVFHFKINSVEFYGLKEDGQKKYEGIGCDSFPNVAHDCAGSE